jgi:hypothetical protein
MGELVRSRVVPATLARVAPRTILKQSRWAAIARFVERWYAKPLGGAGASPKDIQRAERRLRRTLPLAVREWYALVGRRFCDVNQDRAQTLDGLKAENDRLPIWWENQGNWSFDVELGTDDDEPMVSLASDVALWRRRGGLTEALLGMLYSDTLVGVWNGCGNGPLGPLAPDVVGGCRGERMAKRTQSEVRRNVARLPALHVMTNPHYDEPLRGHEALVIRSGGEGWEWMAATPTAYAEAATILLLDAPGDPRYLVVTFDPIPPNARQAVCDIIQGEAGPPVHHHHASCSPPPPNPKRATLEFSTHDPEATLTALRSWLPPRLTKIMRAGHRSPHAMVFVPCWPPGATHFTEPQ